MGFAFPATLDARLVADAAFAAAYDALRPEERGNLKTAVARTVAAQTSRVSPEVPARVSAKTMRQGFVLHERVAPAQWAAVFFDAAYAGAARVLAALVPALLAGVRHIAVCRVAPGGRAGCFPDSVLAGLELAGQELVAEMEPEGAASFLRACCDLDARGRVVLLGGGDALNLPADAAAQRSLPSRRHAAPIRIGIDGQSLPHGLSFPGKALESAHPDALFVPFASDGGALSAIYCGEDAVPRHLGSAPLVLAPGQEWCWAWPDIGVAFFQERSAGFSAGTDNGTV